MGKVIRVGIAVRLVVKHLVIVLIERLKLEANHESVSERLRCELEEVWLYEVILLICTRHGGDNTPRLMSLTVIIGSYIMRGRNLLEVMSSLPG